MYRSSMPVLIALFTLTIASLASAQDTGGARMQLSFDHGAAIVLANPPGGWDWPVTFDVAADFRVYAPEGVGIVLCIGALGFGAELEPGIAYRTTVAGDANVGLELQVAAGASGWLGSIGFGSLGAGVGGWAQAGLDARLGARVIGFAVTARALYVSGEEPSDVDRSGIFASVGPMLRVGGEWGL